MRDTLGEASIPYNAVPKNLRLTICLFRLHGQESIWAARRSMQDQTVLAFDVAISKTDQLKNVDNHILPAFSYSNQLRKRSLWLVQMRFTLKFLNTAESPTKAREILFQRHSNNYCCLTYASYDHVYTDQSYITRDLRRILNQYKDSTETLERRSQRVGDRSLFIERNHNAARR